MLAVVAAVLLAAAAPARAADLPKSKPLVAYATMTPTVHLFGDTVTADVTALGDPARIDTRRVRLFVDFRPYVLDAPVQRTDGLSGGLAYVHYRFRLQCVSIDCITVFPTEQQTTNTHLRKAHLAYMPRAGKGKPLIDIGVRWPTVELVSRIHRATTERNQVFAAWSAHVNPPPAPRYRAPLALLAYGAYGLGSLFLLGMLSAAALWLRARRPAASAPLGPEPTPRERALALLEQARGEPDAAARRAALERFALELGQDGALPEVARRLAWSRADPDPQSIAELGARAREELR